MFHLSISLKAARTYKTITTVLVATVMLVAILRPVHAEEKKSFLWEVTSPTTTIYLLGSVHALKPESYPLNQKFYDAFDKSAKLVVEIDMTKVDQAKIMQAVMKDGVYMPGTSLKEDLGEETYAAFMKFLEDNQLPTAQFTKFKPGMIWMTLSTLQFQKLGYSPMHGIDLHFTQKANEKKLPVLALEKVEDQLSLFLDPTMDKKKLIKHIMKEWNNTEAHLNTMMKSWSAGDAKQMNQDVIVDAMKKDPDSKPFIKKFLIDRNDKMVKKVEGYLKTEDIHFVIAGAAHMVGESGLPEQLKAKGFKVVQH